MYKQLLPLLIPHDFSEPPEILIVKVNLTLPCFKQNLINVFLETPVKVSLKLLFVQILRIDIVILLKANLSVG